MLDEIFNNTFKLEAYYSQKVENSLNSKSFFRREVVARVQAVALSMIAALALVGVALYMIGYGLASLGYAVIKCKSPLSYAGNVRNVLMILVKFTQNLCGTIAGTIVGVFHPKTARKIFLPEDQTFKEMNPVMNPKEAAELYWMLGKVDQLFKTEGISYVMFAGSALGHDRHEGIIPWDDDADLMIGPNDEKKFLNLKTQLATLGLEVLKCPLGYKIYSKNGRELPEDNGLGIPLKYNFPFIDVYTTQEEKGNIVPTHADTRKYFANEYYTAKEWASIQPSKFGPIQLNFLKNERENLKRNYGSGYNIYGCQVFSHTTFKVMIPFMFYFKKEAGSERHCARAIRYDQDHYNKLLNPTVVQAVLKTL